MIVRIARTALASLLILSAPAVAVAAPPTLSVVGKISGPDGGWDYASVDQSTRQLFVGRTYGVMAVDLDSGKVTGTLTPGDGVHGVIAVGDTGFAISANGKSKLAIIFDKKTGKVAASIPTGEDPDAVMYDPSTGLVAIMEGDAHDALLIDPKAMKAVGNIPLDGQPEFAAPDGQGHFFVNIVGTHEVAYVDIASRKVLRRSPLNGCQGPTGLAYDVADDLVLSACRNGIADVTEGKTGVARASITTGEGADAAIYDAGNHVFYVPCGRAGNLAVIAVKSPTDISLASAVTTELGARTGAFDSKTGKLYLPTAQFQPATEPGKRPQPVPGTFEIVVVGPQATIK
jgi:DNA-binding beta-propeller fold protein YncE